QEIARNVQQAAGGTREVSANIGGVTQAAKQTGAAASEVLGASSELSKQASLVRSQVEKFLAAVRAA
ncbi:MAG TPA: methyl-accepting chemotaxis protein, partial [Stellaceae bacterium]|nr:methyl-accepting chemotaxis protein [Stellaceae bacterium]